MHTQLTLRGATVLKGLGKGIITAGKLLLVLWLGRAVLLMPSTCVRADSSRQAQTPAPRTPALLYVTEPRRPAGSASSSLQPGRLPEASLQRRPLSHPQVHVYVPRPQTRYESWWEINRSGKAPVPTRSVPPYHPPHKQTKPAPRPALKPAPAAPPPPPKPPWNSKKSATTKPPKAAEAAPSRSASKRSAASPGRQCGKSSGNSRK